MSVMFGPYTVLGRVAVGSTGTVYRARHGELDRLAAIKELHGSVRGVPGMVERYRSEAGTLAALDDPHVVAVYDFVEEPERVWIAQEWVDGSSLEAILVAHGRLGAEQSLGVLRGALTGLAHAHERGMVHRDVAPGNILADRWGTSKLVDFGVAAPVGGTGVCGTPAFVSPEAARGEGVGKAGDVYSAAAVLYLLLSGGPPLPAGDAAAALRRHVEDVPAPLSGHGPHLGDLVGRALAKDPALRPVDARAFLEELEEAAAQRYGAGWLQRASISGLVASTLAGGATAVGATGAATGAVSGAAGETVVVTTASASTGTAATAASGARGLGHALRTSRTAQVFAAAAAVVVVAAAAATASTLGGRGADDGEGDGDSAVKAGAASVDASSTPDLTPEPEPEPLTLADSAPVGVYEVVDVVTASDYPEAPVGSTYNTEQWTLDFRCAEASCSGTVGIGGEGFSATFDGTTMTVEGTLSSTDEGICFDPETGEDVPGTTYKDETTGSFSPLTATERAPAEGGGPGVPEVMTGTLEATTTTVETTGGCVADPPRHLALARTVTRVG